MNNVVFYQREKSKHILLTTQTLVHKSEKAFGTPEQMTVKTDTIFHLRNTLEK